MELTTSVQNTNLKNTLKQAQKQNIPGEIPNKQTKTSTEDKQECLLDFSSVFKKNGFVKRPMPKLGADRKTQNQGPNWLLQIPAKLQITLQDMQERRYMSQQRWNKIVKVRSQQDETFASVCTITNWLMKSNIKTEFKYYSVDDYKKLFTEKEIKMDCLTRRQIIMQCLKNYQNQQSFDLKVHQINNPEGTNKELFDYVIKNIKCTTKAFLYICYGKVLCFIGYQNTPLVPLDAYKKLSQIDPKQLQMWIICGSFIRNSYPLVIKRLADIQKQLLCNWPQYLNLQQTKKGKQTWQENPDNADIKIKQKSCLIQISLTSSQ